MVIISICSNNRLIIKILITLPVKESTVLNEPSNHSLTSLTSQYGVSDTLKSMFEGLRETPGINGSKFTEQNINQFAQYIVCRNYGKLCLELSYLLFFITNYQRHEAKNTSSTLLEFFWLEESFSVNRFREYFKTPYQNTDCSMALLSVNKLPENTVPSSTLASNLTPLLLTLTWSNKSSSNFSISPTRAGVLAVLFEFLMMIKPSLIEHAQTELLNGDDKKIKALSSYFQKELYAFLMDHLTVAQVQRRFRYITQWLHKENYNQQFLTDDCILHFWQSVNTDSHLDNSLSFKLYSVVFDDLVNIDQAIKQSEHAFEVEHSISIGGNIEQGEVSESALQNYVFDHIEDEQNYNFLIADPKFLTKAQWQTLQPLVKYQKYQKTLALSLARLATFSTWQAVIVQAKRNSPATVKEKLAAELSSHYITFIEQLTVLKTTVSDVLLALVYIYFKHQNSACITELLKELTSQQQGFHKQHLKEKLSELPAHELSNQRAIFNVFQTMILASPELQKELANAKKAFTKNNKSGFKSLPQRHDLPIYNEGQAALQHCFELLTKQIHHYESLWKNESEAQDKFRSDAFIFKQSFEQMYCVEE